VAEEREAINDISEDVEVEVEVEDCQAGKVPCL
jgi:hypothetical protein